MPQPNRKRQTKTPPVAPYMPPVTRLLIPANCYVAQMVVLDPPEAVRKHKKRK